MKAIPICFAIGVLTSGAAFGQDVTQLSLEDLLNTPVGVATHEARPLREVPGIITVVTREEIVNSGARDLIDVLRLVPGFEFDGDVDNEVNLGFRGLSGANKILLMVDGIDLNDHMYQDLFFGNHYPIDNVDHIEIVRGAGSVVYGGSAEYAVINLVSRDAAALKGASISAMYGQQARGLDRRNLNVAAGQTFDNGWGLTFSGLIGQGKRSDRTYTDFSGNVSDLAAKYNNDLDPLFLNAGATYKDLKLRVLFDRYYTTTIDSAGVSYSTAGPMNSQLFTALAADIQYDWKWNDRLKITPRLTYWTQRPWQSPTDSPGFYDKTCERWDAKVVAGYEVNSYVHLNVGTEAYTETAWLNYVELAGTGFQTPFNGSNVAHNADVAGFGEVALDSPWVNATLGARYEYHSTTHASWAPRLALTKVLGRFHAKLLYSEAFRNPGFEEIALVDPNNPIHTERVNLAEAEVGYQFTDHLFARFNLFNMIVKDTLVYYSDPATNQESYGNFQQTGSRGVEAEVRAKYDWGFANLTYSFYTAGGINEVALYAVPGQPQPLLAYPQHKVTLNASIAVWRNLSVNPSAMIYSGRWGYLTGDPNNPGQGLLGQTSAGALLNVMVRYRDLGVQGLDVGVGIYNLLDDPYAFIQAYNAGHAPTPAPSRDFLAQATYRFGL